MGAHRAGHGLDGSAATGVTLPSNTGGIYHGDARYEPFYASPARSPAYSRLSSPRPEPTAATLCRMLAWNSGAPAPSAR